METMSLTTPALLFPAISLLLLAYTNRFLTLAQVIRQMHPGRDAGVPDLVWRQLPGLHYRVRLIQYMQGFGVVSFLFCALSMFVLFIEQYKAGQVLFGFSILALALSLIVSLVEVLISTHALNIVLDDMASRKGAANAAPPPEDDADGSFPPS